MVKALLLMTWKSEIRSYLKLGSRNNLFSEAHIKLTQWEFLICQWYALLQKVSTQPFQDLVNLHTKDIAPL